MEKCVGICKTYDVIQAAYVKELVQKEEILEFQCNVVLEGLDYMSDFLCTKQDGSFMVRECVFRDKLSRPHTIKVLEESRQYWRRRGITDWGIVINAEK